MESTVPEQSRSLERYQREHLRFANSVCTIDPTDITTQALVGHPILPLAARALVSRQDEDHDGIFPTSQRLVRGNLGERLAAEALARDGHEILIYKPDIRETNRRGIDIVTIRSGVLYLADNKALTRSGNVAAASASTTHFPRNLEEVSRQLNEELERLGRSTLELSLLRQAIDALQAGNYVRAVTNANVSRNTQILTGVSERLRGQGITLINVFP